MKNVTLVYMVAGMSSRFGGKIKQFARVGKNNETLIELSLNQALKAGFNKIIFVVGNLTEGPFKEMFGDNYGGIPVFYTYQKFDSKARNKPWGTGDAVCSIKEIIDQDFVICNGDDIYGEESFRILTEHIRESDECATIGYKLIHSIPERGAVKRGIFEEKDGYVNEMKEVFDIERDNLEKIGLNENSLCSMNLFAFSREMLNELNKRVEKFKERNKNNKDAECLLPVELSGLIKDKKIKIKIHSTPEKWIGITNPEDEEIVREILKNN